MKKYFLPALALLLFSCQKEMETETVAEETPVRANHTVTIHASFGDEATKTLFSQDGEGKYRTAWEVGDVISIREHVVGVTSDPNLSNIDVYSDWTESDPLTAGGETAEFTASFDPYYWENMTAEELATYTFTYTYVACSMPRYSLYTQSDEKGEYIPLLMPIQQNIYASGFLTADELLVSRTTDPFTTRPSEISFNFARLGTIVEITLSGLQEGDIVKSGSWYTGDSFIPGVSMENCIAYYPDLQEYVKLVEMQGEMSGPVFEHRIDFNAENTPAIVADAEGKAKIYLRCLPGQFNDWFGLLCTVDRGGSDVVLAKEVSLKDLGRSLEFKDGGLTKFSVSLLPAVNVLPEMVQYTTSNSANRDGFQAVWERGEHVAGYECYYTMWDSEEKHELPVTAIDADYVGVTVDSGLVPDEYYLHIKGIPEAGYGPASFDWLEKILVVGETVSLEINGNATLIQTVDGISSYVIKNRTNWYREYADEFAYFLASNTKFGSYYGGSSTADDRSSLWWFRTAPSQLFPGGLESIEFTLGKWYDASNYIEAEVYGIDALNNEIAIHDPARETVNDKKYKYDLSGFQGVKISCASSATLNSIYLNYYK